MKALEFLELAVVPRCLNVKRARQVQRMLAAKHQRGRKVPTFSSPPPPKRGDWSSSTTTRTSTGSPA
jgi:hypothetical protein